MQIGDTTFFFFTIIPLLVISIEADKYMIYLLIDVILDDEAKQKVVLMA